MIERFSLVVGVGLLLIKDDKILLLQRSPHLKFGGGKYCLPGGCVDGNETIRHAVVREAQEELGIIVELQDLEFVNVSHIKDPSECLFFSFFVRNWQGTPFNKEPHMHDTLEWFPLDKLPQTTLPRTVEMLKAYKEKVAYAEYGW